MVDLLSSEEAVIDKAKSLLEQEKSIPAKVRSHFEELLKAYIKLNKGQSRLIRLSDKSQDKLNIANAKLENFSSKLSKYFSPKVYQSLFTGELDVKIETKRKQLTVFFSDLQGFTELTERLEPEVLTKLLTHYLTEMSRISIKWGGTIDKFIGDAILVFFGDPVTKGNKEDAVACVLMALEMLDKIESIREFWRDRGVARPLNVRMGVHTGVCTVGNFGSEDRLDYTVIGNGVNLASRLESNSEPNQILISEDTYLLVKEQVQCKQKETITVKGISHPIQTYQVINLHHSKESDNKPLEHKIPGLSLTLDPSGLLTPDFVLTISAFITEPFLILL